MSKESEFETVRCLNQQCGYEMDTGFDVPDEGVEELPSICVNCGNIAIFTRSEAGELLLRAITEDEMTELRKSDSWEKYSEIIRETQMSFAAGNSILDKRRKH